MPSDDRCLDDDELSAWLSGALTEAELSSARAHIERCEPCRSLLAQCAIEPEPELERGDAVGPYVVLERVGAGAMGVVYAAYDPRLDRKIALKVHRSVDPTDAARTTAEARALARCSHRNVVSVHDVGTHGDRVFIAMELIDGPTLDHWARGRSWRDVLAAVIAAGEGLAAAHRARVIHRDFKPQNVIVSRDGRVCVTDFGLARLERSTRAGGVGASATDVLRTGLAGTPLYMAPELFDGAPANEQSDQWALAVSAWELLFAQRPFEGATLEGLVRATREGAPRGERGAVVPAVRAALARALSPAPSERFSSVDALVQALSRALQRRNAGLAIVSLAALAVGAAFASMSRARHNACPVAAATFDSVWSHSAENSVRASFLQRDPADGPALFDGTSRVLRAWGTRFERERSAACAAFEQRGVVEPLRTTCIEHGLAVTRALVHELASGANHERAIAAATALPEVDECALAESRGRALTPLSAQARQHERALLDRHAALLAQRLTALDATVADRASQLRTDAAAVGHWTLASRASAMVSELTSSRAAAVEALAYATRASDAEALADGWLALLRNAARFSNDADLAIASSMAEASIAQLGGDPRREGARLRFECSALEHRARDIPAARAVCERALHTLRAAPGDPRVLLMEVESALGMLSMHERRYEQALASFDRVYAQARALSGPRSSTITSTLNNRCEALVALGRIEDAERGYAQLLEVEPTHAGALDGLAKVRVAQGRAGEAAVLAERALVVVRGARWEFAEKLVLATLAEARCANAEAAAAGDAVRRARSLAGEMPADADARLRTVERRLRDAQCVTR